MANHIFIAGAVSIANFVIGITTRNVKITISNNQVFGHFSRGIAISNSTGSLITGNTIREPNFPGGLLEWKVEQGTLVNEAGPTTDVTLQWATYFDAADDAGISRLYGGIHISADDLAGRRLGARCGQDAWARALRYFDGTARS